MEEIGVCEDEKQMSGHLCERVCAKEGNTRNSWVCERMCGEVWERGRGVLCVTASTHSNTKR